MQTEDVPNVRRTSGVIATSDGPGISFMTTNRGIVTLAFATWADAESACNAIETILAKTVVTNSHTMGP
jgi:hypothetical protein